MNAEYLPKEITDRIESEGEMMALVSHDLIDADSWKSGAVSEATRAQLLIQALEHIAKGTHNGETVYQFSLRVQNIAIDILQRYNQPL